MRLVTDKHTVKRLVREVIALPEIGNSIKVNGLIQKAKKALQKIGITGVAASEYLLSLERDLNRKIDDYVNWTEDDFAEDAFNYSLEESIIEADINEFELNEEGMKLKLKEENPFAAAAKKDDSGGGEEAPKDDGGGEEKDDKKKKKPEPENDALSIEFEPARVKSYNDKNFRSTSGEVTKITKDGMTVKIKPDDVDVHVNFDDISESVKSFFKK